MHGPARPGGMRFATPISVASCHASATICIVIGTKTTMATPPSLNALSDASYTKETTAGIAQDKYHYAPPDPPLFQQNVNEQGFLTSHGKESVQEFEKEVRSLLSCGTAVAEVRTIGSILINLIQTQISDRIAKIEFASNRVSKLMEKKVV